MEDISGMTSEDLLVTLENPFVPTDSACSWWGSKQDQRRYPAVSSLLDFPLQFLLGSEE